jgi:hypothetical protein
MEDHTDRTEFRLVLELHIQVQDPVTLRSRVLESTADEDSPGNDDLAQLVRRVIGHELKDVGSEAGFSADIHAMTRHYGGADESYPSVSLPSVTDEGPHKA